MSMNDSEQAYGRKTKPLMVFRNLKWSNWQTQRISCLRPHIDSQNRIAILPSKIGGDLAKLAICSIIRNEEPYLEEWVAFHLLQGVCHFLIFDDRSSDRTLQIASRMSSAAKARFGATIEVVANPVRTSSFDEDQKRAYRVGATHLAGLVEFVAFIDVDEFLFARNGSIVSRELDLIPKDISAIAICQRVFGSSGHQNYNPFLVTERFVHCTREDHTENRWFKTIARPTEVIDFFNVHQTRLSSGRYILPNGDPLVLDDEHSGTALNIVFGPIYLNHYMLKSNEEYKIKRTRGEQRGLKERYTDAYFSGRNTTQWANACFNSDLLSWSPKIKEVMAMLGFANLTLRGFATQSSISEWSNGSTVEQDAAGAIDGCVDGKRSFHTAMEENPWWEVDLGKAMPIFEIRIFNTTHPVAKDRFKQFKISIAFDHGMWIDIFEKHDGADIGGIDSCPFIWKPQLSAFARYVRITAMGYCFLHLDQVEVYGKDIEDKGAAKIICAHDLNDRDVFEKFISLGDNCEFGLVQNKVGIESLDLFRFGGTGPDETGLIQCVKDRFVNFATALDLLISTRSDGGRMTQSQLYELEFHTNRGSIGAIESDVLLQEQRRLGFLAKKLMRDLESAEKIFVRKSNKFVSTQTMFALYAAMRIYGRPELLWVVLADDNHSHSTVERLAPGFFKGYIRRLAPYDNATDVHVSDWRDVCLELIRQRTRSRVNDQGSSPWPVPFA